jgi:isoquinoline 1-oxidoreductase subunit beta
VGKWTRRAFIATGGLIGGGLVLGVAGVVFAPNRLGVVPADDEGTSRLTTWIKITPDNVVTVVMPHCEMGQGSQTALAMMLAEELDADWSRVRIEEAPADDAFSNGYLIRAFIPPSYAVPKTLDRALDYASFKLTELFGFQTTGGSASIRGTGQYGMRVAGAAARGMLIEVAARRWGVSPSACQTSHSEVIHPGSAQRAAYGDLVRDAAQLEPPTHPPLKSSDQYRLVGRSQPRVDLPSKVNGSAIYGIDVQLPELLYATIKTAPVFGGKLEAVDDGAARNLPGVHRVVRLDNAVAVVADGYWRALKAVNALRPRFGDGGNSTVNTAEIFAAQAKALGDAKSAYDRGEGAKALEGATKRIRAEYRVPLVAHATMEPMSATARVANGRCEVWVGVQDPLAARKVAAEAAGLQPELVRVHNQQLGGGFGRRLPGNLDFVDQAVRIAREVTPRPVKLIWSREEDLQHDFYRPAVLAQFEGALNERGQPVVWVTRFNGASDVHAAHFAYEIPHQEMLTAGAKSHVRQGAWRSVAHSQHGFFTESFIDELAHAAGKDPYQFRRALLANDARHLAVLDAVARMAQWGSPLPAGRGRGIALVESFGTIVAEVAEVSVDAQSHVKVERVCAAVDCGELVNPDAGLAQIEGGIVFGLSAVLFDAITIEHGRVRQSNFYDYRIPKLADAPRIEVQFLKSTAPMGGLGEPGVPPIAAAVANAVFAATGKRVRELPLRL